MMERIDDFPEPLLPIRSTFFFLLRVSMLLEVSQAQDQVAYCYVLPAAGLEMEVGFEVSQGKAGEGKSTLDLMFRSTYKSGS